MPNPANFNVPQTSQREDGAREETRRFGLFDVPARDAAPGTRCHSAVPGSRAERFWNAFFNVPASGT
jgi:hypothetical protein